MTARLKRIIHESPDKIPVVPCGVFDDWTRVTIPFGVKIERLDLEISSSFDNTGWRLGGINGREVDVTVGMFLPDFLAVLSYLKPITFHENLEKLPEKK